MGRGAGLRGRWFWALAGATVFAAILGTLLRREHRGERRRRPHPTRLPPVVATEAGTLPLEDEYIAGVVDCELAHFTASPAALEAQAIAARTYLASYLERRGQDARVTTGPEFQCWRKPVHARSRAAALATAGLVARHRGELISANYAAGAPERGAGCAALPPVWFGYRHATWEDMRAAYRGGERFAGVAWTELLVTMNRGRRGAAVTPTLQRGWTTLNRGAFGQHAAICLAERERLDAAAIVRAFYGEDVDIGP